MSEIFQQVSKNILSEEKDILSKEEDILSEAEENILSEELNTILNSMTKKNIVFNPIKYRLQNANKKLNKLEKNYYKKYLWTNISLCSDNCKTTLKNQEVFSIKDLLIKLLIEKAKSANKNSNIDEVSLDFLILVNSIIDKENSKNPNNKQNKK